MADNGNSEISGVIPTRKVVAIEYPGNVINDEKALQTLGGLAVINEASIDFTTLFC